MALRVWPERVLVTQDGIGGQNAACFDVDTGETLTTVLRVVIERQATTVQVTMSKHDPYELAIDHPGEPEQSGIVVETREYPITSLRLEAGIGQ